jgi:hypothetical protein
VTGQAYRERHRTIPDGKSFALSLDSPSSDLLTCAESAWLQKASQRTGLPLGDIFSMGFHGSLPDTHNSAAAMLVAH